jgi:hypothetical protein
VYRRDGAAPLPNDRGQLVKKLGAAELAAWARAQSREVQALVLATHRGDTNWLKSELENVTRFVRLAPRRDDRVGRAYFYTNERDITHDEADKLNRVGLGRLVKQTATSDAMRYCGLTIETGSTLRAGAFAAVRAIDRELNDAITRGEVVLEDVPLDECRARAIAHRN